MNRCSLYCIVWMHSHKFEEKKWYESPINKTKNMKNVELYIICSNKRKSNNKDNSTEEIYKILLLGNFVLWVSIILFFPPSSSASSSLFCYLEYIILNWRLLLFLSKLVMMLILVLVLLFLLIDPLYMNLSSKHSKKNET